MTTRCNPAVYAGLIGGAMAMAPTVASAATIAGHEVTPLMVGVGIVDVVVIAGTAYVVNRILRGDLERRHKAVPAPTPEEWAHTSESAYASGSHAVPAAVEKDVEAVTPARRGRHFRTTGEQATFSSSPDATGMAASVYKPRHMRAVDWESTGSIRVHAPEAAPAAESVARKTPKRAASQPLATPKPDPASQAPAHAARDYEQIAENYARRETFRARMATRAQGVAATLKARMGSSMMEGLPVIERADGTVGDVGTAWWTESVGFAISSDSGFAAEDAIPSDFGNDLSAAWEARNNSQLADPIPMGDAAEVRTARADAIADRVAFIDGGAFPEVHNAEDPTSSEDMWASALAALEEKAEAQAEVVPAPVLPIVSFSDPVGDADTLDDPEGLEPPTEFILFRTPAGHPEVVDTETYIDYLLNEEFSRNSSKAVRRTSANYLRMLEGGTSKHLATSEDDGFVGKHFARPDDLDEAREA